MLSILSLINSNVSDSDSTESKRTQDYTPEHMDYSRDIFNSMRCIENKFIINPSYLSRKGGQISKKMRGVLVDWMYEVNHYLNFDDETFFLTVNIIDRYLQLVNVPKHRLQLVGITTLFIASKYEEISYPFCEDYASLTDGLVTVEQIISAEATILSTLKFDVTVATPNKFLEYYFSVIDVDEAGRRFAKYLIEKVQLEYSMLKYLPSMISASAIYVMFEHQKNPDLWPESLELLTGYKKDDLMECVTDMKDLCSKPSETLKSIDRRYNL